MSYAPGQNAELITTFVDINGQAADPDAVSVQIYDPSGAPVDMTVGDLLHLEVGTYQYNYPIPADAPLGNWRIDWLGTIGGHDVPGSETFIVTEVVSSLASTAELASHLRSRLGEVKKIPTGNGSETLFDDTALIEILAYANNNLDVATLEGWRRKQARYSHLIDIAESGAERPLRQKFTNAKMMTDMWTGVVNRNAQAASEAMRGRVVGKPLSLRSDGSEGNWGLFESRPVTSVRPYLTKRLLIPAILS